MGTNMQNTILYIKQILIKKIYLQISKKPTYLHIGYNVVILSNIKR